MRNLRFKFLIFRFRFAGFGRMTFAPFRDNLSLLRIFFTGNLKIYG